MCRAIDVAEVMIEESINLREKYNDDRYYLDFYKLNKLMYIAQGVALSKKSRTIFVDDIFAYKCGPYIKELEYVFFDWGFNPISKKYNVEIVLPPDIREILVKVLEDFGMHDRHILGLLAKSQKPWKDYFESDENAQIIPVPAIEEHFSNNDLAQELENVLQES